MKRLLLAAFIVAFSICGQAQTHVVPTLDRNNTWSGSNDFTGTFKINGKTLPACTVNGQVWTWNGSTWTCAVPAGGGGATSPDVVSVADYGALGDGTTDDSAAFALAITAANTNGMCVWVPVPTSSYRVNLTHSSATYPLCIKGVPNRSILKPYADGIPQLSPSMRRANSVQPITLEGLVIQGSERIHQLGIGIVFKGGYTGSTLVESDHHNLQHLVIDGTTSYLFTSLIEVHGRMIWSTFRDLNLKYGYAGIKVTEDDTNEYNGAFNKNTFDARDNPADQGARIRN
jgi:hypothetical protein